MSAKRKSTQKTALPLLRQLPKVVMEHIRHTAGIAKVPVAVVVTVMLAMIVAQSQGKAKVVPKTRAKRR